MKHTIHPIMNRVNKISFSLTIFLILFFWGVRLGLYPLLDGRIESQDVRSLVSIGFRFLIFVLPVLIYVKKVDREPLHISLKLTTNIFTGIIASLAIVVIALAWQYILFMLQVERVTFYSFLDLLGRTIIPGLFEEILIRGFLLHRLMRVAQFWKANLISSVIFVSLHWPAWIVTTGMAPEIILIRTIGIFFIISLPLGYLFKKTNSLWPCVTFHTMVNFVSQI